MRRRRDIGFWLPPVAATVLLWVSVGSVRTLTEWLRARGQLANVIWVVLGVLVVLAVVHQFRSAVSHRRFWQDAAVVSLAAALCAWGMTRLVVATEERMHFIIAATITYLYYRWFRAAMPHSKWVPVWAGAAGTLVGGIEEALQRFTPGRQFDWRDVGLNALAAVFAAVVITVVLDRRAPTENRVGR